MISDRFHSSQQSVNELQPIISSRPMVYVRRYTVDDSDVVFGELALMYDAPRAASITAVSDVRLWRLHGVVFKRTVMSMCKVRLSERWRSASCSSRVPPRGF